MEYKCPRCGKEILIAKYKLVNCECGARLLLANVNGNLEIYDLALTKEAEDERD